MSTLDYLNISISVLALLLSFYVYWINRVHIDVSIERWKFDIDQLFATSFNLSTQTPDGEYNGDFKANSFTKLGLLIDSPHLPNSATVEFQIAKQSLIRQFFFKTKKYKTYSKKINFNN